MSIVLSSKHSIINISQNNSQTNILELPEISVVILGYDETGICL